MSSDNKNTWKDCNNFYAIIHCGKVAQPTTTAAPTKTVPFETTTNNSSTQ